MQRLGRGGGNTGPRESVDMAVVAQEVVTLLAREAELCHVQLRCEQTEPAPKVRAVSDQMHQVILNLLLNAIAATPEEGEVVVRIVAADQGVRVDVSDTGPGISPEHMELVFDPFFTTKEPDQGTGLGLMVCHRIITDHDGSIEARSREGEGATFSLWLPGEDRDSEANDRAPAGTPVA
jgi:two-component system sensor histidine kinase HydH